MQQQLIIIVAVAIRLATTCFHSVDAQIVFTTAAPPPAPYSWCNSITDPQTCKRQSPTCEYFHFQCVPGCSTIPITSCAAWPHCEAFAVSAQQQRMCIFRCSAFRSTNPDGCWTNSADKCWFYKKKCRPRCDVFSSSADACTAAASSRNEALCYWGTKSGQSQCLLDARVAQDSVACDMIQSMAPDGVTWDFADKVCRRRCSDYSNAGQAACEAAGTQCEWVGSSYTSPCTERCSRATNEYTCGLLSDWSGSCTWLSGGTKIAQRCVRSCAFTLIKQGDASACNALPQCGVTQSSNTCRGMVCRLGTTQFSCGLIGGACQWIANQCVNTCDFDAQFGKGDQCSVMVNGVNICAVHSQTRSCRTAQCSSLGALGEDGCSSFDHCFWDASSNKCRLQCSAVETVSVCNSMDYCYLLQPNPYIAGQCLTRGCNRFPRLQSANPSFCVSSIDTATSKQCSWRDSKCLASVRCTDIKNQATCNATELCEWVQNGFIVPICLATVNNVPARQCSRYSAYRQWDSGHCKCELSCYLRGANDLYQCQGFMSMCTVDELGLCAPPRNFETYDLSCLNPFAGMSTGEIVWLVVGGVLVVAGGRKGVLAVRARCSKPDDSTNGNGSSAANNNNSTNSPSSGSGGWMRLGTAPQDDDDSGAPAASSGQGQSTAVVAATAASQHQNSNNTNSSSSENNKNNSNSGATALTIYGAPATSSSVVAAGTELQPMSATTTTVTPTATLFAMVAEHEDE